MVEIEKKCFHTENGVIIVRAGFPVTISGSLH